MVSLKTIDAQLDKVGMRNKFFARPEIRELCHILAPNEVIQHAVNGHYEGGFALLVATNRRLLLIDKKPWFLTMEDIRYEMISEVDYFGRLLDSSVHLNMLNKKLVFTTWRQGRLREMVRYIQHRVMDGQHQHADEEASTAFRKAAPNLLGQQAASTNNDFATTYKARIKQHSMAHMAGRMAVDIARRKSPIVKPLYPRPSLMMRYGRTSVGARK